MNAKRLRRVFTRPRTAYNSPTIIFIDSTCYSDIETCSVVGTTASWRVTLRSASGQRNFTNYFSFHCGNMAKREWRYTSPNFNIFRKLYARMNSNVGEIQVLTRSIDPRGLTSCRTKCIDRAMCMPRRCNWNARTRLRGIRGGTRSVPHISRTVAYQPDGAP